MQRKVRPRTLPLGLKPDMTYGVNGWPEGRPFQTSLSSEIVVRHRLGLEMRLNQKSSSFQHALHAPGLGAAVGNAIVLAVKAEDEHGAAVHVAAWLVGSNFRRNVALGIDVTDAFTEAASTELFGAAEKVDRVVGIVRGDAGFHGAEMLVTEWKDVRPHV